jgi:hypothetical protein
MRKKAWVRTQKLPDKNEFHVLPQDDTHEHEISHICLCGPSFDLEESNGKVIAVAVVHRPWDSRPSPLEAEQEDG